MLPGGTLGILSIAQSILSGYVDFSYVCVCSRGPGPADLSFCCFGPCCGRGRPQDLSERVGLGICCRNQGSLPSGIGSEAIFGGGGPPRGSSLCRTKKCFCVPQRSLKST